MRQTLLLCLFFSNSLLAQVNLSQGLVAYYPFTGNANDVSGNNNNPVFNNATPAPDRFGNPNSACQFNGIDNCIRIPNSPSLNPANQISICAWVKVAGFYQGACHGNNIVMKGDADFLPGNYMIRFDDSYYTNNQNCNITVPDINHETFFGLQEIPFPNTPFVQTNQWYSVVYTCDGTTAKIYINCVLAGSGPANGITFSNTYDLFLGRLNAPQYPYWFNGVMDEVRIYNRTINQDEVNAYGGCATLACNDWLYTNSAGSSVKIGDLDVTGNQITVEAQINRTAPWAGSYIYAGDIVSKHNSPADCNYLLRPNNGEITTTNGYFTTPPICEIELNKTYHVAFVYNGSSLKFYRNGFLMSQVAATGNLFQNSWITTIGDYAIANPLGTNFTGYINEVRIWNTARTQAQLQSYMNSSLPNPASQAGLLAYYTFNSLVNQQGNAAWNGTLTGTAAINQTNPNCTFIADSCQVVTGISGIINDYTPVLSLNPCTNKITVENAAALNVGDTVLMIEMKGAVIDSSDTPNFGGVTDFKNSGNYEFNYVKSKAGNIIELKNKLTKQYDVPNGKVQLVRVPYYQSISVASTLTCLPWDGNKGGVLVFNVQDTLILNANIDASGKGFRGGKSPNSSQLSVTCFTNGNYYPVGSVQAAERGESVYDPGTDKKWGKAHVASGGGSGVDHNSGGGGGGNGGRGGKGGYEVEGCGGGPFDNGGRGGFEDWGAGNSKVFMGGGGGSGHANNMGGFNMDGGNGGGIIIIKSNFIKGNSNKIISQGADGAFCDSLLHDCNDGNGGGGAGGSILLHINNYINNTGIDVTGGKGANLTSFNQALLRDRVGPGGGGGGGLLRFKDSPTTPPNTTITILGGMNGVILSDNNNPYGATAGSVGNTLLGLVLPFDTVLFTPNIDSVRIKDSITGCRSFDFKGLAYTNTNPIANWQWYFGDGGIAGTQNTNHTYTNPGTYTVKLVVTDINGCKDSISKNVTTSTIPNFDFGYQVNICNPLSVQFSGVGNDTQNPYWSFGDGGITTGNLNPGHTYSSQGNYIIRYSVSNGSCTDTISKTINLSIIPDDIILTHDTTICAGSTKQLLTASSLSFCWSPATWLNNPNIANPVTSTPQNITYYFTAQTQGTNLITNGDFAAGNTGFTSQYSYATPNVTEGQYYVGASPQAWNPSLSNCPDHTTGTGNMMLVNGSPTPNVRVWSETVTVIPNTNYAFSTWIQALWTPNPAQLQFSINGSDIGIPITASLPTCTWTQFYTTWNSGNNTSATISIVNKNTQIQGNDFALDDISFAPVFIKRDSVKITVENPAVRTSNDTAVCAGIQVQLNTTGANTYIWTPAAGLSNSAIANPVATPATTTQYIVTGTTANGCIAKDTVNITISPLPVITRSADTVICKNSSTQLFASGGLSYSWSPAASLNNPSIANPVATPAATTIYFVTVTGANTCNNIDSVKVSIRPDPVFAISPPASVCRNDSIPLTASGGNIYTWQPSSGINNPNISNPIAFPQNTTIYTVQITETACNNSATLSTTVTVNPLPNVQANKSNDIDCTTDFSQLSASGASQYLWTPGNTLNNPAIASPIARPVVQTQYVVRGKDINGCVNYDTVTVDITGLNKGGYLMPSGFTPNNDGINDCYGIKYWGVIEKLDFAVFNRWGEEIFHTTKIGDCWNGIYKGVQQNPDVYVYLITAKTSCGSVFRKGTFVLIR